MLGQPEQHLARARALLAEFKEREALAALELARRSAQREPKLLAQVYLWEGITFGALADQARAVQSFRNALVLEPGLELPAGLSPRVVAWWEVAGGRRASVEAPAQPPPPPVAPPDAAAATPTEVTAPAPAPLPAPPAAVEVHAPEPPPSPMRPGRVVGALTAALGMGSVGAASVIGWLQRGTVARLEQTVELTPYRALHRQAQTEALVANLLFGVGAALILAGLLVFLLG